ncbi:MAG: SMC family ATPase [Saprospiraceae bacterium]|nr:SMC family ATPase [Saprospiraceae bacterium]
MRPVRLEMEGFTAFRKPTVVEFEGAEIFVLSGPTGSGKSSIIDAMTFALYGSVPRYDDLKLVYPVISQGKLLMKVRFDFDINQKRYTAIRVVRKMGKDQATTKEARLECGTEVLAGSARDMSDQVKKLLGLDFEQFNTCIVLPQGQFARFLNEKPAKRQDLLKDLLNMHVYSKIGSKAREITGIKDAELTVKLKSLDDFAFYTSELLILEKNKCSKLKEANEELEKLQSTFEELLGISVKRAEEIAKKEDLLRQLRDIEIPESAAVLNQFEGQSKTVILAQEKWQEAEVKLEKTGNALDQLPDPLSIKDQIHQRERLQSDLNKLEKLQSEVDSKKLLFEIATKAVSDLDEKYNSAQSDYEHLRQNHWLHEITGGLKVGDPCPVCERILDAIPSAEDTGHLLSLEREVKILFEKMRDAEHQKTATQADLNSLHSQMNVLSGEIQKIKDDLDSKQTLEDLQKILVEIGHIQLVIKSQKSNIRELKNKYDTSNEILKKTEYRISTVWDQFDQVRDSLAILSPPASDRKDLGASLDQFNTWREEKKVLLEGTISDLKVDLAKTEAIIKTTRLQMQAVFLKSALTFPQNDRWQEVIIRALTESENQIQLIGDGLKKQKLIQQEIKDLKQQIVLYKSLGSHMKANAFERWLLQEAFKNLVFDGSARLKELSTGDYSFALDESLNFDIIDHRNADEVRSSRTLSGGETFLASLALALSLADQLAELASGGAAKLESMFLDEGFGTLDSDTLDTVASTIEALSARGRMIGLVTHVKDLADRMPVQFRVSKGADTSTVEKLVS